MSIENQSLSSAEPEPLRRRGDRRLNDQAVPDDRRKQDRRDIPGVGALIRTLFRRRPSKDS